MIFLSQISFWGTVGFLVLQAFLVALFVRKLSKTGQNVDDQNRNLSDDVSVAIVLCIRGKDPSLEDCLQALLAQQYSNRQIFLIGDSEDDPAIQLARQYENENAEQVTVLVNQDIQKNCGLKCSNLIFALSRLESDFDFFLLVDADTIPHSGWLQEMIGPFRDEKVMVTTGIRWFDVGGDLWGTWVRYVWNTAAIVQTVCYGIPWGGSLALRTSFLRDAEVLDSWSHGFCEDTMLQTLVSRFGGRVEVVPQAVIRNPEQTRLSSCTPWIGRQLLTARLHHPRWPFVLGHGFLTAVFSFGLPALVVVCLLLGNLIAAGWFAAAYAVLQLGNVALLDWIESPIRRRRIDKSSLLRNPFRFLVSIPLTQVCYVIAMLGAIFARKVEWRKIEYLIRGRKVEMVEYRPYEQSSESESL